MTKPEIKQDQVSQSAAPKPDMSSSSPGNVSPSVTPKDVSPDEASAKDVTERKIHSDDLEEREEALLDEAIELSFPASDPISVPSYEKAQEKKKAGKNEFQSG